MSTFTITTITEQPTPFELASGEWARFLSKEPFDTWRESRRPHGTHGESIDMTLADNFLSLCNWLAHCQGTLRQQGLAVSELVLVLWVLGCLEPGLRSLLERSLAKEQAAVENIGFNTLKLHLEVWALVLMAPDHRRHWRRTTGEEVEPSEFWAGQGAQKHADLVRRWQAAMAWLSGANDVVMLG